MHRPARALFALLCLLAPFADAAGDLALTACHVTDPSGVAGLDAECGTLTVPENPEAPEGAQVTLRVVRVPALSGAAPESAFTVIQGGPGGSSVDLYLTLPGAFEGVRRDRDILLVDQRGTGGSDAMECAPGEFDPLLDLGTDPSLARRVAEECLAALSVDPRFYTTSLAVRDLDAVRAALGYETLDLYGVSYGTRVALHYLRRYPDRVRTLVLDAVVPTGWILGPTVARDAQRTFDRLAARCREDAACAERFGDPARRLAELLERVDAAPMIVEVRHPVSGTPERLALDRDRIALAIRMLSYQGESAALLPLLVDRAADGDAAPLAAQVLIVADALGKSIAAGMHNAVVCSEDIPFADGEIDAEDTYLGATTLAAMEAVCDIWPPGVVDPDLHEPFDAAVPALVLSGTEDPITPPANGSAAARALPGSLELVGEGQGHGIAFRGCLPRVIADFVAAADTAELDVSCVDDFAPPPPFLSFSGPAP